MEIVKAKKKYAQGYCRALGQVASEGKWLASSEGIPLEDCKSFIAACSFTRSVQLFLLDGKEVVGWCDIVPLAVGEKIDDKVGSLGIGIVESARGHGWGGKLIDKALDMARRRFEKVVLFVREDNERAKELYFSRGFTVIERYEKGEYKNVDSPVLKMQRGQ